MWTVMKSHRAKISSSSTSSTWSALGARKCQVRIVSQHAHPEHNRPPGHFRADAAHPGDAELPCWSAPRPKTPCASIRPLSSRHAPAESCARADINIEKVSSAVEIVLPPRGVHHHDAPLRGGVHVHVVHAHARAADDAQFRRRLDHLAGDFGSPDRTTIASTSATIGSISGLRLAGASAQRYIKFWPPLEQRNALRGRSGHKSLIFILTNEPRQFREKPPVWSINLRCS